MKQPFWAKVYFMDFVGHYVGMSDKEILKDVKESIVALTRNDDSTSSFGSKIVRSSKERIKARAARASRENGSFGGRPPKLPSWTEFLDYVNREGLDYTDARQWWEMTMVDRNGKDRYGNPIGHWIKSLHGFLKSKEEKRSA